MADALRIVTGFGPHEIDSTYCEVRTRIERITNEGLTMSTATIAEQVAEFNVGFEKQIGPELSADFSEEQANLRSAGHPQDAVSVGDAVPDADLLTAESESTTLQAVRGTRPAVLVFYRGAWCPYCNIALRTYQRDLVPALDELGVGLIAISPQTPDGTRAIAEGAQLSFPVLSDPSNELAKKLGIVTEPSAKARLAHTALGFDVADSNADGTADIPFPSVVILDEDGVARWVDIHVDYTTRSEVDDIITAVRALVVESEPAA